MRQSNASRPGVPYKTKGESSTRALYDFINSVNQAETPRTQVHKPDAERPSRWLLAVLWCLWMSIGSI